MLNNFGFLLYFDIEYVIVNLLRKKAMTDKALTFTAKLIVSSCFRNSYLEDLHAGKTPISKTGDFSDVIVIDAEGRRIPWNEVSRINDDEMKTLMKNSVNNTYKFLKHSDDPKYISGLQRINSTALLQWDEPEE